MICLTQTSPKIWKLHSHLNNFQRKKNSVNTETDFFDEITKSFFNPSYYRSTRTIFLNSSKLKISLLNELLINKMRVFIILVTNLFDFRYRHDLFSSYCLQSESENTSNWHLKNETPNRIRTENFIKTSRIQSQYTKCSD